MSLSAPTSKIDVPDVPLLEVVLVEVVDVDVDVASVVESDPLTVPKLESGDPLVEPPVEVEVVDVEVVDISSAG